MSRLAPAPLTLALAAVGFLSVCATACGDDRVGLTGTDSDQNLPPITSATITSNSPTTTDAASTTGDTSGTSGTTGAEEASTTTSGPSDLTTTSTTSGMEDCAPADDADEDGDAIANKDDNCRCVANPKQLDFDGDKLGNVCDEPLVFTVVDGLPPDYNKLVTTAKYERQTAYCLIPIGMVIEGGEVLVQLDDAGQGLLWFKRLDFGLTPEQTCDFKIGGFASIMELKLYIKDFFAEGPDMFPVHFPFLVTDHAMGVLNGILTAPHRLLFTSTLVVSESSNWSLAMPEEQMLDKREGFYPAAIVSVLDEGQALEVKFGNNKGLVYDQTTTSGFRLTMNGLKGKLRLVQ